MRISSAAASLINLTSAQSLGRREGALERAPAPQARAAGDGWTPAARRPAVVTTPTGSAQFGQRIAGWDTNPRVPAPMARWAADALDAHSPQKNPGGDGVKNLYGGDETGMLPPGLAAARGRARLAFFAEHTFKGQTVYLLAHQPEGGRQRVEMMTPRGTLLGSRQLDLSRFQGPMTVRASNTHPGYRWPEPRS